MPQLEPYIYTPSSSPESSLFLFYTLFALPGPFILAHNSIITSEHHVGRFQPDSTLFLFEHFLFWYTWQVHSPNLGKLEQFLGISRATRSHPLLKINKTCNPRNILVSQAFSHVSTANLPAVCIPLCDSRGQLAFGSGRFLE